MNNDEFDYGHAVIRTNSLCPDCELALKDKSVCNKCPFNNFKNDKR